jgi:hypothetical protein
VCKHEFEIKLSNVTQNNSWCQYCCVPTKIMCKNENCEWCLKKSFKSHPKEKFWHPTKNGDVKPRDLLLNSHTKVWFNCEDCKHEFDTRLSNVSQGSWCLYCAHQKLCNNLNCEYCFLRSFKSHPNSGSWHKTKNGNVKPRYVFKNKNTSKFWFECDVCKHDFDISLNNVSQGNWCPYCCVPIRKLCESDDCKWCLRKSFQSHHKSEFWNFIRNGNVKPRYVTLNADKKYWFTCGDCKNEFEIKLGNITQNNSWCPNCTNKTEAKLFDFLMEFYETERQKTFDWCVYVESKKSAKFDFFIPSLSIIIELDGDQHFRQVRNWDSPEEQFKKDVFKTRKCLENGMTIIRIYQPDVYYDKNNWQKRLISSIKLYETPRLIVLHDQKYERLLNEFLNV